MKYTIFSVILCFFATIKVAADIFGFEKLSAVAAMTNVAPAMKVFTAHKGYETYSSIFELSVSYLNGGVETVQLSPSNYSGLKGPYNRRNVYGALIAFGPVLVNNLRTREMWHVMAEKAFCGKFGVLDELGFLNGSGVEKATIRYLGQVEVIDIYLTELGVQCE